MSSLALFLSLFLVSVYTSPEPEAVTGTHTVRMSKRRQEMPGNGMKLLLVFLSFLPDA